jgi:hypothetical protein
MFQKPLDCDLANRLRSVLCLIAKDTRSLYHNRAPSLGGLERRLYHTRHFSNCTYHRELFITAW